ncbi:hypothetical protein [uncultured Sphingomonas sp.]|uniref:hypothetical protein n=1 Tax=uncultured Sphingomonas sp. TaxID=158754 RepID=UPI0025F343A3|nr:hypothetical protein [uncultured Sphingomonas sp.]
MKTITLIGPTSVTVAGEMAVRRPYEGPLTVTNKEAARLQAAGVLAADPVDADGVDPVDNNPEPDAA